MNSLAGLMGRVASGNVNYKDIRPGRSKAVDLICRYLDSVEAGPAAGAASIFSRLLGCIKSVGWAHLSVLPGDDCSFDGPPPYGNWDPVFTYSIGLFKTYGHAEIIILGLPPELAINILCHAADLIKEGRAFEQERRVADVFVNYDCVLKPVDATVYRHFLKAAIWFYDGANFPALQAVWPDARGRFPWEPGVTDGYLRVQPGLYKPWSELAAELEVTDPEGEEEEIISVM